MTLDDLEVASGSPSLSKSGCKSNDVCFSDGEQTDETLLNSPTDSGSSNNERKFFGWFGYQPKCLQKLLSAKWALFWMCWAGALQGKQLEINLIVSLIIIAILNIINQM